MQIAQYHAQALGSALKVRDLSDQEAKKSLSSRGFGLYERSKKYSRNLTYDENCNGSITLLRRDGTEYLTLSNNATYCYCKDWIAYVGIECAHLYVARNKKFDIGLWKPHFPIQKRLDVASPHWDKTSQRHLAMYHLWRVMALNVFLREKTMNQTGPKVIVLCTKSMATFRRS
ncbi:hypothetical protein IV203_023830 [Nitzschia inconspicua]|uniref:SWIM-type domain-containing protein n=1 Tax=Nitzschia inconspicua TaxID=303405 RepID=A0A9K3PAG5_9STRA|nr:hypothetical protein IV203_023830 [Nitzschia inconspicua]